MSIIDDLAGLFSNPVCTVWKTNPLFWQTVAAVRIARANGVINNKEQCLEKAQQGKEIADGFAIPEFISESLGSCVCDFVFDFEVGPVVVFEHDNFEGDNQAFNPGIYRADQDQMDDIGNDSISSVMVLPGFKVRLCEHEGDGNGAGQCVELGPGNYQSMNDFGFNDKASFIQVEVITSQPAPSPLPEARSMNQGMSGLDVRRWQVFLATRGFFPGRPDGQFGSRTHDQTVAFQKEHQIFQDGIVGKQTRNKAVQLGFDRILLTDSDTPTIEPRTLRQGMNGLDVKQWQVFLATRDFFPGRPDSQFGPRTHQQTIALQAAHNLVKDGVVGKQTRGRAKQLGLDRIQILS